MNESLGESVLGERDRLKKELAALTEENARLRADLAICETNANDWKQGMAGQEERASKAESRLSRAIAALETARAALHHCDIRHKKCTCSKEALQEVDPVLKELEG